MATTSTLGHIAPASAHPTWARVTWLAGACLAAVAVWAVAVPLLGTHLLVRFGSGPGLGVGIESVVGASLTSSLLGWGLLALLERRTDRARMIWSRAAVVTLLASLSLPLSAGANISSKAALALMHLAVAAVLIPGLRRN
ncbi:MAG: DUF6069 family protein [Candidatus Dormiibacterota bacterium]